MPRLPRRKVPLAIALKVALRQLGFKKPELDHDPALGLRERTPDGKYIPDEHDPDHLVWREAEDHAVKTRGNGATTAGSDVHVIAKTKRLAKAEEEHRRRMLAQYCAVSDPPSRRKRTIPSRPFPKVARPMRKEMNRCG